MTVPDPTAARLRSRAVRLRQSAHQLDQSEWWSLRSRAGADTWIGPSATAFHERLGVAESALRHADHALRTAAARLDRAADAAEAAAVLRAAQAAAAAGSGSGPA